MKSRPVPTGQTFIPFGRPDYSGGEIEAVERVLRSGWVGRGSETSAFEDELAMATGAERVLAVNSCTSALFLSLLVIGVGPDDEVICPSLTWLADANVILQLGARPVFCDVDPETLGVTPASIREKLTKRTKAVIVVHFGGLACDVAAIRDVLPNTVQVIEDAAHAFGAHYADGRPVGSSANITCFSFYANKNLSTGDGGAIALSDARLADRIGWLRQNGLRKDTFDRYHSPPVREGLHIVEPGFKMGYSDLLASLGRVQLRRHAEFAERRASIARCYVEHLRSASPLVTFQTDILESRHAKHLLVVRLPLDRMTISRDMLLTQLHQRNVGAAIHYAPLHHQAIYGAPSYLEVTDNLCDALLTLPISVSMTLEEAEYCARQLSDLLDHYST